MKIIVLDGYALNPGDLDWGAVEALGELTVYDRTHPDEVLVRAEDAPMLLTNKTPITRETIEQLPALKYIGVMATGYNIVDIEAASEHGVVVTNVAGYSTHAVAQHTFALMLALINRVETHSELVHAGQWVASKDFTFRKTPLLELAGKRLGLFGLGDIGQKVADIALAFGMEVLAYRRNPSKTSDSRIQMVSLDELFTSSDFISLHAPLTPETRHVVDSKRLEQMKSSAFLINTARGPLIEEEALALALEKGQIAGAGLDVLSTEPPKADNPLLNAKNCVITPHIAWSLFEARQRLMGLIAENIQAFQAGKSLNRVN